MHNYRSRVVVFIFFLTTFGLASGLAHAANQAITMTPTSVSPYIEPGSVYKGSFEVLNQGKTGYKFLDYASPYEVNNQDYTPDFTALPTAPNITSWFNFSTPGGYINPGQKLIIDYTISVPENTQPGGYYAAAFAETQYPKAANGISLNERVGEIFYIQVAGPVVKKGSVATWQSSFLQKPPLTSTLRLQNDGSIHFQSNIHIYVKDVLGHTKYSLYTQKELLPQTVRRITIPWVETPRIGLFKVTGNAEFLGQNHVLGTKWVLVMSSATRQIIITVIVLVIVLAGARTLYRSRRKGRKVRKL